MFVDSEFVAACPIDVALSLDLRKGLELTDDLLAQLKKEDRRIVLRQKAYSFATYKPRTQKQVLTFLNAKEATQEEADDVMKWLVEFRVVNDSQYAERYIVAALEQKPVSRIKARQTLIRKGVPEDIVDLALEKLYSEDDALTSARRVAQKKARIIRASTEQEREQKLVRFLIYRGYPWDVVRTVLAELKQGALVLASLLALSFSVTAQVTTKVDSEFTQARASEPKHKVLMLTSDGLCMLVVGPYGSRGQQCLALLHRTHSQAEYSRVEPVIIPGVASIKKNISATMSDDRMHLIVALEHAVDNSGVELYHTSRGSNGWSKLESLGNTLNTPGLEGLPDLSSDSRTLYYVDAKDVYVTKRIGDGWTNWTLPINTSALDVSRDPQTQPGPWCRFILRVADAVTGEPLSKATWSITDSTSKCTSGELPLDSTLAQGIVALAEGGRYHIRTTLQHYLPHVQTIGIRNIDSTVDLRVAVKLFDTRRPIASVFFDRGSAQLRPEDQDVLKKLVQDLQTMQVAFNVIGYTDLVGATPKNKTLSEQRAESVTEHLRQLGLGSARLRTLGRGIENPGTLFMLKENPQSRRVDIFPAVP